MRPLQQSTAVNSTLVCIITFRFKLYKSLILPIALSGFESWTLLTELEKVVKSTEMKNIQSLIRISWKQKKANEFIRAAINEKVGKQDELLTTVKHRKLA